MSTPTSPRPASPPAAHGYPLLAGETAERGDAARNRRLLLDAATRLVAERGVDGVTMEDVAAAAGVGKGTVFRRFGSRAGLMLALLDHGEREFQRAFMFGPPPLGPGAEPIDRLVAFGRARLSMLETQGDIIRAAESNVLTRYGAPPYLLNVAHVATLLREAGVSGNVRLCADLLLGGLAADLVLHQRRTLRIPLDEIERNWARSARAIATR